MWWELVPGQHILVAKATLDDGTILESEPIPFQVDAYVPPGERPTSGPAE